MTRLLAGAGILALVGLLVWLYGSARYEAGRLAERVVWQAKTVEAVRDDLAIKTRIDGARAAVTQESSNDLEAKLADAVARAAHRHAGLCDAAPRDRAVPDMPGPADTAVAADGAGEAAVMADDRSVSGQQASDDAACAENTVKAQGWQDWWRGVAAGG